MIQKETRLVVADNTGAKLVLCFNIPKGTRHRYARVGDIIVCSVKDAAPDGQVKAHTVVRAVVIRTTRPVKRADGSTVRSDDNACVIVNDKGEPVGSRVFGPVFRELRGDKRFKAIISKAPEVI
jgi:large subunit ribosomal protein L14